MTDPAQAHAIERASRAYLRLLASAPAEPRQRHAALASVLDDLCVAYNRTTEVEPETVELVAPAPDVDELGKLAGTAFPELGFYAKADPIAGLDQPITQGWGLDDLTDIARDLTDVIWLFEQHRARDAIWDFRWGYENHWGHHLHDLRRYLHKLLYWG